MLAFSKHSDSCPRKSRLLGGLVALLIQGGALSLSATSLPSSYDLNQDGLLTPVKNQENLGSCWAFGTTTAFQSSLLKQGIVSSPTSPDLDLSIWHLATANGNNADITPNAAGEYDDWGGNSAYAVGYWTRGRGQWDLKPSAGMLPAGGGPVMVSNNPLNVYPAEAVNHGLFLGPYVPPASQTQSPYMLSQSVSYYWNGNVDDLASYQDRLKAGILKYGALSVAVSADNPLTDRGNAVFYAPDPDTQADHEVALIGWDDDIQLIYGDLTFTGGWLIQNSWGAQGGNQ